MALNNRIYKYTCDTCSRSVERIADSARPDPLRCVITDQCEGKLTLTASRFGLRPTNTAPVVGLLDRIKRGSSREETQLATPLDKASLSSFAGSNGLSLALLQSEVTSSEIAYRVLSGSEWKVLERTPLTAVAPSELKVTAVLFELTPAALEYKRYTYNRSERAIYVQGRDDSAAQRTLAFDDTSNVRVFVNGALLDSSLYDKTVSGTITFTPELEALTLLIEVFVYKSLTQFFTDDEALRLDFVPLQPLASERTGCAWGDALKVGSYTPLYCPDVSALDQTKTYGLVRFEAVDESAETVIVDPIGYFLLADPPYALEDKRLTSIVNVSSLVIEGFPLSFAINPETGATATVIDGETLFPLIRSLQVERASYVTNTQELEQVALLAVKHEKAYILGPA